MRFRRLLIALSLLSVLAGGAFAQGYVDILPDEIKGPFFEKRKIIVEYLTKEPVNEWVGQYHIDAGLTWSEMLAWHPEKGFAAFRDTCSNGPRAWVNYGGASFQNGVLRLSPERNKDDEFVLELPSTEFTPVKWGQQHWLVPSDHLALFAYAVNSGSDDPYQIGYQKADDRDKRQTRSPDLPSPYRHLLVLPPIMAKVVEVGEEPESWYPELTIDAGKNKRVIEGMSFWLTGHKVISMKVTVTEVRERSSRVRVIGVGISGGSDPEIVPAVGWRFSSRFPSKTF